MYDECFDRFHSSNKLFSKKLTFFMSLLLTKIDGDKKRPRC